MTQSTYVEVDSMEEITAIDRKSSTRRWSLYNIVEYYNSELLYALPAQ